MGINYISSAHKKAFMRQLQRVEDQDYFERGLELAIAEDGLLSSRWNVSDLYAVEVDFAEDLGAGEPLRLTPIPESPAPVVGPAFRRFRGLTP